MNRVGLLIQTNMTSQALDKAKFKTINIVVQQL